MFSKKQIEELVQGIADDYELKEDLSDDVLDVVEGAEEINMSGDLTANSIIENMSGYSAELGDDSNDFTPVYVGACKTGNKITFVIFGTIYFETTPTSSNPTLIKFYVPDTVWGKLYPYIVGGSQRLSQGTIPAFKGLSTYDNIIYDVFKLMTEPHGVRFDLQGVNGLSANTTYAIRIEQTFLLSDNLIGD